MRILCVHGRGQAGKTSDALLDEWIEALEKGFSAIGRQMPARASFDMPFYGDELAKFTTSPEGAPGVATMGSGDDTEYELFARDVLLQIQTDANLEAAVRAEIGDPAVVAMGFENWGWVQKLAEFIDQRWTGAVDFTIERFLRDVFLYTRRTNVANAINKIVFDALTDEPTVAVGHSLGSIVSYNVISAQHRQRKFVKHVTVGSPLGITAIAAQLGVPQNLATTGWYNAYDRDDIVALNPLDAKHFNTKPAIENNGAVDNRTSNQHGIAGYLNDPPTATVIADAIQAPNT